MSRVLTFLRSAATRAVVAWLVAFGLLLQTLLPVLALHAKAQGQTDVVFGVICSSTSGDQSGNGIGSKPLDDGHAGDCCSVCALIHATHLIVPAVASPDILVWPTRARPVEPSADDRLTIAQAATPYSSRAPPQAF